MALDSAGLTVQQGLRFSRAYGLAEFSKVYQGLGCTRVEGLAGFRERRGLGFRTFY